MERQVSVVTDIFKMKQIQPLYPVSLKASQMEASRDHFGAKTDRMLNFNKSSSYDKTGNKNGSTYFLTWLQREFKL